MTVPQCLEILFLSPRRQDWTKNVKYVIFDEVNNEIIPFLHQSMDFFSEHDLYFSKEGQSH